jgi:hypothetical protein
MIVLAAALVLTGCLPEERTWWSPDGSRALVVINGHLHLVAENGAPGEALFSSGEGENPPTAAWLPDGSGFVMARERRVSQWAQAKALLAQAEADEIERLAAVVPVLLESAAKLGDEPLLDLRRAFDFHGHRAWLAALLRAREEDPEGVDKSLLALPDGEDWLENIKAQKAGFSLHEVAVVRLAGGRPDGLPKVLAASLNPLSQLAVSPKFPAVAFQMQTGDEDMPAGPIELRDLNGRAFTAFDGDALSLAWAADGRTLVFASPAGGRADSLVQIYARMVLGSDGTLPSADPAADPAGQPGEPTLLATLLPAGLPRPHPLPDGRVLIAARPSSLPEAGGAPESIARLYLVASDGTGIDPVPQHPEAPPLGEPFLAVSPDGSKVAVIESQNATVNVINLESGAVTAVAPPRPGWRTRTLPSWKSDTELTFAGLIADRPVWLKWSENAGTLILSGNWPEDSTDDWLENKPNQEPARPESGEPAA